MYIFFQINTSSKAIHPTLSSAEDFGIAIMREIHYKTIPSADAIELFALLQSPHLQVSDFILSCFVFFRGQILALIVEIY